MSKKLLSLGILCAALSLQALNAQKDDAVVRSLHKKLDSTLPAASKASSGFRFDAGNGSALTLGGEIKSEYVRQHNVTTMNSALPDEHGFHASRVEIDAGIDAGAVQVGSKMRYKYQAGRFDKAISSSPSQVKLNDIVVDLPSAGINHTLPWFKHLWMSVDLNAFFGRKADTNHTVKVGLFDYQLGRGITFGPFYGTQKSYLGVFNASNDFSPFGINLAGDLVKDCIGYDLYFARLEEKSADFKQTFNRSKSHIVGNRANSWTGVGKANDVFAATLKMNYGHTRLGDFKSDTYVMYNDASDQKVEMINDSKSQLLTYGTCFEYSNGNFELGGEVALNRGHEKLYNIDRNVITTTNAKDFPIGTDDNGDVNSLKISGITPVYSHVKVSNGYGLMTDEVISAVNNYDGNANDVTIGTTTIGAAMDVDNASNRFRPAYKNTYRGWTAVVDGAYLWKAVNAKLGFTVGHASGDVNPHNSETDKNYHGFVGLNENYDGGKRVKSVLMLNARKIQRPMSTNSNDKALIDNSFTDITYVGGGISYKLAKHDCSLSANVLSYWKDKEANKYSGGVLNEIARRHLGIEANLCFEWKVLKGLDIAGQLALFGPGNYYKDIKGFPLDGSIVTELDVADTSGAVQAVPGLGTNVAFHANVGMRYKF